MILLTIIIPAFNASKYLTETVNSILSLPQDEVEIIIVNDGSTDTTLEIAEDFKNKKSNIKVISQENQGVCLARNNGLLSASGKYVMFLDSDDLVISEEFQNVFNTLKEQYVDIIIGNGHYYVNNQIEKKFSDDQVSLTLGIVSGPEFYLKTSSNKEFNQYSEIYVIRREFLLENKIFYTPRIVHEDKEFTAICFALAKSVIYTGRYYILYRKHDESLSNTVNRHLSPKGIEDYIKVINNLGKRINTTTDPNSIKVLEKILAECYLNIYRRIILMKKNEVREVSKFDWKYVNQSNCFSLLSFKWKFAVLKKRLKALIIL